MKKTNPNAKHMQLIDSLEERLKQKGFQTFREMEYKDQINNTCGEIDLLAIMDGYYLIFEMKSNFTKSNHRHAMTVIS